MKRKPRGLVRSEAKKRKSVPARFYRTSHVTSETEANDTMGKKAVRALGTAAAGTLGFIAEGMPGAVVAGITANNGIYAMQNSSQKSNMKGSSTSIVNMNAGRASMKKSGKVKNVKKGKKVTVSAKLREKINEVLKGKAYIGKYVETAQGSVGMIKSGSDSVYPTNSNVNRVLGAQGSQIFFIPIYKNSVLNSRCLFAGSTSLVIGAGPSIGYDTSLRNYWHHFSPMWFLDAASQLWNKKPKNEDWAAESAYNFDFQPLIKTGALGNTSANSSKPIGDLKLVVVNSYAQYTLKNNGDRRMFLKFYHCTPKLKFPKVDALTDLFNCIDIESGGTDSSGAPTLITAPRLSYIVNLDGSSDKLGIDRILQNPAFDPSDSVMFKSRWNIQEVTISIAGGETCNHSIQGPKNTVIDYAKLVQQYSTGNLWGVPVMCKGYSVSAFCAVLPDLQFGDANTVNLDVTGRFTPHNGAPYPASTCYDRITQPISVEVTTTAILRCPEQSGFIQQAEAAGITQNLNLKRRSLVMNNYCYDTVETAQAYAKIDEENPMAIDAADQRG